MAREIMLVGGQTALVDDADHERLATFRWYPIEGRRGAIYAYRSAARLRKDGTPFKTSRQMQRDVLDPEWSAPRTLLADHINGDTLDNRRENLRWATFEVSNRNRRPFLSNSSGYRGVSLCRTSGKFRAQIWVNGRRLSSPYFFNAEEAAAAYNEFARTHHGEYAKLNTLSGNNG